MNPCLWDTAPIAADPKKVNFSFAGLGLCYIKFSIMDRQVHEALRQVKGLKRQILDKQRFRGYSGRARALGGCVALVMALLQSTPLYPQERFWILAGWASVFACAVVLNYGAVLYWLFSKYPRGERDVSRVVHVLEALPALLVGGVITLGLILRGYDELLPGVWCLGLGLANLAQRRILPPMISWVGVYYIVAGSVLLCVFEPVGAWWWQAGLLFFIGEWLAGFALHFDHFQTRSVRSFFGLPAATTTFTKHER